MRLAEALHFSEIGEGVSVLLLHPALNSSELFLDQRHGGVASWIAARGCRVLCADLPGHGRSQNLNAFEADYLELCAAGVLATLDQERLRRVAIVGVGVGAQVALHFTVAHPRRVSCLVADSIPGSSALVSPEPWTGLAPLGPEGERQLSRWRDFSSTAHWRAQFTALGRKLTRPSLIITCGDGEPSEVAGLYELSREKPQLHLALLPGDAPPACLRAPGFFLKEVEAFLAAFA